MAVVNTAQIKNPSITIRPSEVFKSYIRSIKATSDMPIGLSEIVFKNKPKIKKSSFTPKYLITDDDRQFIESLNLETNLPKRAKPEVPKEETINKEDKLLKLEDLHWLHSYIEKQNETSKKKVYLHELLEDSEVILPKNELVPRSPELEQRCKLLKAQQQNRDYQNMTKNVDNARRRLPEDTISYQLKQMNRHLIAIFQFIVSVMAGFAFGFIGVELIIGNLDFGFRLLLGIICSLIIALAELYFLAKRLNEDLQLEYTTDKQNQHVKID